MGVFGCFEVTIGWYGKERIDYITYDTKGTWRCYEIKVSKSDFHSKAKHTFIGHYNYYVMTQDLYNQVKDEIPSYIGVYVKNNLIKRPKKQELKVDEQILKNSMIRSLCREVEKSIKANDVDYVYMINKHNKKLKKENDHYKKLYYELYSKIYEKYGEKALRELK